MIKTIHLRNVYSFKKIALKIKPLTIIIGFNNSGKTNLFRSILVMKQFLLSTFMVRPNDYPKFRFPIYFENYKRFLELFKYRYRDLDNTCSMDVVCEYIPEKECFFEDRVLQLTCSPNFMENSVETSLKIKVSNKNEREVSNNTSSVNLKIKTTGHSLQVEKINKNRGISDSDLFWSLFRSFENKDSSYSLDKKRIDLVKKAFSITDSLYDKLEPLNFAFAFRIQYLNVGSNYLLSDQIKLEKKPFDFRFLPFIEQVSLSNIFTSLQYHSPLIKEVDKNLRIVFKEDPLSLSLELKPEYMLDVSVKQKEIDFRLNYIADSYYRALNYIVRMLLCKDYTTFLLQEPDNHFDVRNQRNLLEMLIKITQSKHSNLILSTHSEHILYALTPLLREHILDPEDLAIYYFERVKDHSNSLYTKFREIHLDEDYHLEEMPVHFETILRELEET